MPYLKAREEDEVLVLRRHLWCSCDILQVMLVMTALAADLAQIKQIKQEEFDVFRGSELLSIQAPFSP